MANLLWYTVLEFCQGACKIKPTKNLATESYTCQWFSYIQQLERFKINEITFGFEHSKIEFQIKLSTNDEHVNAKIHRRLLKFETEMK